MDAGLVKVCSGWAGSGFMGKRLLLVEDEPTLARALVRLLRRAGYEVVLAVSCVEAERVQDAFAVGVFDIDLPDGDGIDLAERLHRGGVVGRAVFFSGTMIATQRVRATRIGPFVEKSKGFPELQGAIENVLGCKHAKVVGDEATPLDEAAEPPESGPRSRN
jgi:DNA-binding response OmpR family regulator